MVRAPVDAVRVVCTFNGAKADLKWLANDWVQAGLPRPRPYKHVDLYAVARREFAFESRSLRHLCERLGLPNKDGHYNADEARAAAAGDVKAQRRLERYNKTDTRVTEAVFDRLRPWLPTTLNLGVYWMDDELRCPACGGDDLVRDGWYTAAVYAYAAYRCGGCGAICRTSHIKARASVRGIR